MSNPDLDRNALLKSAIVPAAVSRRQRRAADAKALQEAYDDVDARDGGVCWATGRYTVSGAVDARVRREHHHLFSRQGRPEHRHDPMRIITVAAEVHDLIHRGWLVVEGATVRKRITFHWAEHVAVRPFRLVSKRWSQNR